VKAFPRRGATGDVFLTTGTDAKDRDGDKIGTVEEPAVGPKRGKVTEIIAKQEPFDGKEVCIPTQFIVEIGELTGGDHTDGHGCPLGSIAIAGLGTAIGAMPHGAQQVVKHNVDGYNQHVVHRSLLQKWLVSATPFSDSAPMNAN